jgi:chemotaxis protein histidine kinase CheA
MMSTQIASEGGTIPGASSGEFQGRLDTLVMLLQAATQVPDMADTTLLEEMIGTLRGSAAEAGYPGVGELLRMWTSALHDVSRRAGTLSADDLVQMTMWFMALQEHAAGRLDANGREMLAQMPDGIRWLPRSSPAFARAIQRKLDHSAVSAHDADTKTDTTAQQDIHGSHAIAAIEADRIDSLDSADGIDVSSAEAESVVMPANDGFAFSSKASVSHEETLSFVPSDDAETPTATLVTAPVITPELLAQLPPEFLAAFPPGALDDLPHDVIEALLVETTQAQEPLPLQTQALADTADDSVFLIGDAEVSAFTADTANDDTMLAFDDGIGESAAVADVKVFDLTSEGAESPTMQIGASNSPLSDVFGSSEFDAQASAFDEPAFDEPASDAPIWIGQEELDLTRQAILDQLMPLAQAWADTPDADANAPILEELAYQSQLIVNVMELIGTHALGHGMNAVRTGIETRDPAVTPEAVATWCSVLLATIEQPSAESGELLGIAAYDIPTLGDDWRDALAAELGRVRIGLDPALIAQRKTLASLEDIGLAPADDVLPSVLDGMLRELPGNASKFGTSVRALADTGAFESIDEARRVAHTLKGDANTVGVRGLANLTHALEDILIELAKRPELLNAECADLLTNASDAVEEIADHLLGRGAPPAHLLDTYQHVLDTANALADGAGAVPAAAKADSPATPSDERESSVTTAIGAAPETARATVVAPQTGMAASGIQSLNVPSVLLDDLQRLAGESLVTARQIDRQLDGLSGLHRDQRQEVRYTQELVSRLDDLVALRGAALQSTAQKAGAELDPLEIDQYNELHVISRQLIEAHADSSEFVRRIERTMSVLADLRSEQEQLNRELQRSILQTRTVPFSQISTRLQRIVRQTSKQVMKPIQLELIGEGIPLDAELLERVVEPLAHLLRNAIDHGIETPERRREIGKPEEGRITMRIGLQGDAAMIDIQDDGAGLDFDAIRTRAIDAGLLDRTQDADERLLTRLILLPGFSTRSSATEVSGRGIGMDVVNQRIAALRGAMTITSERGVGMRVSLRLPVTQTLANVIVARGQRQVSAVVSASVERVVSFTHGECVYDAQEGRLWLMMGDERVPALPIEHFYGANADARMWLDASGVGLQINDANGRATVVLVAGIDEVRSTVVKPISAYLPPIPAVRGITQLGDGGLAPVIDLDVMLQSMQERAMGLQAVSISTAAPATRVVVADDSLSVRRALEQLMQDAGFEVETARDGFEALAAIQSRPTHALLVDLEMPRMNGLEVTRNLRTHADTRDLPVVMITSRATDKHQAMAEQAGVTRMLGKPFSEDSLVALVRELIATQSEKAPP